MKITRLAVFGFLLSGVATSPPSLAEDPPMTASRERIPLNHDWAFARGHATDNGRDVGHAHGYFSYLAKTGFSLGAAAADFDHRLWRKIRLPHDWAVEAPFDSAASHSHGYKAIGSRFPQSSIGWSGRHLWIPDTDLGCRMRIDFDCLWVSLSGNCLESPT